MAGNCHIAVPPGIARAYYAPDAAVQAQVVGAFQDRDFELNLGYAENGDGRREMRRQTLLVIPDSSFRPQTEVRIRSAKCYLARFGGRNQLPGLEPVQFSIRERG